MARMRMRIKTKSGKKSYLTFEHCDSRDFVSRICVFRPERRGYTGWGLRAHSTEDNDWRLIKIPDRLNSFVQIFYYFQRRPLFAEGDQTLVEPSGNYSSVTRLSHGIHKLSADGPHLEVFIYFFLLSGHSYLLMSWLDSWFQTLCFEFSRRFFIFLRKRQATWDNCNLIIMTTSIPMIFFWRKCKSHL